MTRHLLIKPNQDEASSLAKCHSQPSKVGDDTSSPKMPNKVSSFINLEQRLMYHLSSANESWAEAPINENGGIGPKQMKFGPRPQAMKMGV